MGFVWGFSLMFPRAYHVLESKTLGIEEDSVIVVKKDTIPKKDSLVQVKDFSLAVKLQHEGNCYLIPVEVNGIPMKMILDTGASTIVISSIEYEFLRKQKLISDSVQQAESSIANGDTIKCFSTKISNITLGGEEIKDVECIIMENPSAPLLLGMNVLNKLGHISIDYGRNLLILKK
jgi:aspartyl protease family protein